MVCIDCCSRDSLIVRSKFIQYVVALCSSHLLPSGVWRRRRCGGGHRRPRPGGAADPGRRARSDTADHRRLPRLGGVPLSLGRRAGTPAGPAAHHCQLTTKAVTRNSFEGTGVFPSLPYLSFLLFSPSFLPFPLSLAMPPSGPLNPAKIFGVSGFSFPARNGGGQSHM